MDVKMNILGTKFSKGDSISQPLYPPPLPASPSLSISCFSVSRRRESHLTVVNKIKMNATTATTFNPLLISRRIHHLHFIKLKPLLFFFSSSSSSCTSSSPTQTSIQKNLNKKHSKAPLIINYLIDTFGFSKSRATVLSDRYSWINYPEKPQSVINYLQNLGFTHSQITSSVISSPQLLFADIEKTLKPKLEYFQELGFVGSDLGKFISKHSHLLSLSLTKRLIPCVEILKKILINNDDTNQDLIRLLWKCDWVLVKNPQSVLLCNIVYLETTCGIVGSQLSMLLKRQPRLFIMKNSCLRGLVSRVLDMGFSIDSRMFVHVIFTVSSLSDVTFRRKMDFFQSFGFSEDECMEMFRRAPSLFRTSQKKLKLGIEFFMNTVKFSRSQLVHKPTCLMYSMENRVIPRYKVLQLVKSKRLLMKWPSFAPTLCITEEEFLKKFILRYTDDAEELLRAYKGHLLESAHD